VGHEQPNKKWIKSFENNGQWQSYAMDGILKSKMTIILAL
jgi:hypothetical protein